MSDGRGEPDPRGREAQGVGSRGSSEPTPAIGQVWNYMRFTASVPERLLRASSAMIGGALTESSNLLVPHSFKSSQSYSIFVQQMLDFMTHNVGGVERDEATPSTTDVEYYVARKTIGNFVELAGLATLHISPLTILAIMSDVAYGSQAYLRELGQELKDEGVLPQESTIDHANDLLVAIQQASGTTAQAFDLPPVSLDGLKETIQDTTRAVQAIDPSKLYPQAEIDKLWSEMKDVAQREQVSLFEVGGAVSLFTLDRVTDASVGTLTAVKVAGKMLERDVFTHYAAAIEVMQKEGLYQVIAETSAPYREAVWNNFSGTKSTVTEDLLAGRWVGRVWDSMGGWLQAEQSAAGSAATESSATEAQGGTEGHLSVPPDLSIRIQPDVSDLRIAYFSVELPSELANASSMEEIDDADGGDARRKAIRDLLRQGGFRPAGRNKPAQEYLLGVLRRDGELPRIHPAVDVLNQVSVSCGLPISMLAMSQATERWKIRYGSEAESYTFNSAGQSLDLTGLIVICEDKSSLPLGSPIKDSMRGKLKPDDCHVGACFYASAAHLDDHELRRYAAGMVERLRSELSATVGPVQLACSED